MQTTYPLIEWICAQYEKTLILQEAEQHSNGKIMNNKQTPCECKDYRPKEKDNE